MSTALFDLFKFSKLLDITDGKIELMNTLVTMIPTSILCEQQKTLIESLGMEKAYNLLYSKAKSGSLSYNQSFIKKRGLADKRKIIDWQIKIVAFSGWGDLEPALVDFNNNKFLVHFKSSPYPEAYGKAKYAVDFISTGFVAGGLSAAVGMDLDAVETSCRARGDGFCEIEVAVPDKINNLRSSLWEKWGVT